MFDGNAFRTWPYVFVGATLFALLFGAAVAMGEALFEGTVVLTRPVVGLAVAAFLGYIGVAFIVRLEGDEPT